MQTTREKILGSLLGAAIGDAMGAATEVRTREQIIEQFGGPVSEFIAPPDDTFARGSRAGQVTDDFSFIHCIVEQALKDGGITDEGMRLATLAWGSDSYNMEHFAGPTTRSAILRLQGIETEQPYAFLKCDNGKASNGAGMKASPAGLFHPGNPDEAIQAAIKICKPTHYNNIAISGACAVATAVSIALLETSTVDDVICAGISGAKSGMTCCKDASTLAGPSVARRIELAAELAKQAKSMERAMQDISDIIGTGLHIAEAVPAAFGLFAAAKGDAMQAIVAAVNIGNDTDTIAAIVGAIAGAYTGSQGFPLHYQHQLEEVNGYAFRPMADAVFETIA